MIVQLMDIFKYEILSYVGTPYLDELKHHLFIECICCAEEYRASRIRRRVKVIARDQKMRKRVPYIIHMKACLQGEHLLSELQDRAFRPEAVLANLRSRIQ